MYCKECGQQLDSTATFCKYCGSPQPSVRNLEQTSDYAPQSSEIGEDLSDNNSTQEGEISHEEQTRIIRKHKIFFSDNEVLIDMLGSGFLSSLFVQEKFSKSVLICSNKRVYQKGKLFERQQGRIVYVNGEASVDLQYITGMKYFIVSPIHRFIPIMIYLLAAIIALVVGQEMRIDFLKVLAGLMIG